MNEVEKQRRDRETIDKFRALYDERGLSTWGNTFWIGQQIAKSPLDLWVYQEIIAETKPQLIVETGTCIGGSALFFATIFDLLATIVTDRNSATEQHSSIITVDKDSYPNQPKHPRITYLVGDSVDPSVVQEIQQRAQGQRTMVVLDSAHTYEHVRAELAAYADLVTPGCYVVVEDTGMSGAKRAAQEFIESHPDFIVDQVREKHLMTAMRGGWLRRRLE